MEIIEVGGDNVSVYLNLMQSYEGEFSTITKKKPNGAGLFDLDTTLGDNVNGYLLYIDGLPAGLAAIRSTPEKEHEVCEFYIAPCYRNRSFGKALAHDIWHRHRGTWVVKQIAGAEYATAFWQRVIADFTGKRFTTDEFDDPYWGRVTRQIFISPP